MRTALSGLIVYVLISCVGSAIAQMPTDSGWSVRDVASQATAAPQSRAPSAPIVTRRTTFGIPFSVEQSAAQILEVQLFVSTDRGARWHFYSRQRPSDGQFMFRAAGDGQYWFASRTIKVQDRAQPVGQLQPELRVMVDTREPQVEFTADVGAGGEVNTSWNVSDPNLAPNTLKLEYQAVTGGPWEPVAVDMPRDDGVRNTLTGKVSWWPETSARAINVRAEVRDSAGNTSVVNRRVFLPKVALRRPDAEASPKPPPALAEQPAPRPIPEDPFVRQREPSEGATPWPVARSADDPVGEPGQGLPETSHGGGDLAAARENHLAEAERHRALASRDVPADVNHYQAVPSQVQPQVRGQVVSARREVGDAPFGDLPAGERPRMITSRRFQLDYDITAVGPSGVADIELWTTTDNGATWSLWGKDEDRQSPFDVEMEHEGIYGFTIVVASNNGLTGRPPQAGEPADLWVGVDVTKPTARLTSAAYGEGRQAGQLVIQWEAEDRWLAQRPITLQFSESQQGPWTTIASGLPNTGQYSWPADPHTPTQVYLQLDVRDEAGNNNVHQLTDPIDLDGLIPKGRIRGLRPLDSVSRDVTRGHWWR